MQAFPDSPGDLSTFRWAVTHEAAQAELDWFASTRCTFGTYQDALAESSPIFYGGFDVPQLWSAGTARGL